MDRQSNIRLSEDRATVAFLQSRPIGYEKVMYR
jgi:hypothetical protein